MQIRVNDEARTVSPGETLADLLARMALADKRVAVERNGQIVPRSQHARTALHDGDRLEIVVAVGGG